MNLIRLDPDPTVRGANDVRHRMRFTLVTTIRRPFGFGILIEEVSEGGRVVRESFLRIPYDEESKE
jgi:hypothetical protein